MKIEGINMTYEGLVPRIQGSFLSKDQESCSRTSGRSWSVRSPSVLPRLRRQPPCRRSPFVSDPGINIADACAMQISDLAEWVRILDEPSVAPSSAP